MLTADGSIREVLKVGDFRRLWLGQMFSQLAINMMLFVLALRVYQATSSNTAVSFLFLCFGLPAVVFAMLAGVVVDHLDKRVVLIVCNITRAILVGGLLIFPDHLVMMYVLAFFNSIVTQFYVPAEAPMIPRLVPSKLLVSANSLFTFTYYSSMACGFILAGPLLRFAGPFLSFIIICSLFGVAAFNVARVKLTDTVTVDLKKLSHYNVLYLVSRIMRDLSEALRAVSKSRSLTDSLLLLSGTQVVLSILGILGPGFADRVLEIDVRDVSVIILGPAVAGIVLGALWVGTYGVRYKSRVLVNTGILGAGFMLFLISLLVRLERTGSMSWVFNQSVVIPLALLFFFLLGISNSLVDVPANSTLQKEAEGDMRGRVYGILTAAVGGIGVLPVVAGGILADVVGVGKVILILSIVIFSYGIWRVRYNKNIL